MIPDSDIRFIKQVLMPYAGVQKLFLAYSPSRACYPDIWVEKDGVPKITVTAEWRRQSTVERRKRLVHEVLHVIGMRHNESIGYSTIPSRDSYSMKVYRRLHG